MTEHTASDFTSSAKFDRNHGANSGKDHGAFPVMSGDQRADRANTTIQLPLRRSRIVVSCSSGKQARYNAFAVRVNSRQ